MAEGNRRTEARHPEASEVPTERRDEVPVGAFVVIRASSYPQRLDSGAEHRSADETPARSGLVHPSTLRSCDDWRMTSSSTGPATVAYRPDLERKPLEEIAEFRSSTG